jgi:hypothetical protein
MYILFRKLLNNLTFAENFNIHVLRRPPSFTHMHKCIFYEKYIQYKYILHGI